MKVTEDLSVLLASILQISQTNRHGNPLALRLHRTVFGSSSAGAKLCQASFLRKLKSGQQRYSGGDVGNHL